jgi:SAM-dependent methyltransferase
MPPVFEFKHIDEEGHEVLTVLKSADRLNRWMYETIAHASRGRILEIGSGTGNISQQFLEHGHEITLSDIRENYRSILRENFAHYDNLRGVVALDLVDEDFDIKYRELLGTFDTVFALNVIEHIEDDTLAIANCRKLLVPGGVLIILAPAFQWLYNSIDRELFHYRRYRKGDLSRLFVVNGLRVSNAFYWNAFGATGWFAFGTLLKRKVLTLPSVSIYDRLLPVMKYVDVVLHRWFGLSVVVIGTNP